MSTPLPSSPFRGLPIAAKLNVSLLGAFAVALTAQLWPHWRDNPDLSHGFLMPFIFVYLMHEARSGTPRFFRAGAVTRGVELLLLALGTLALGASGLYAAALDWTHSLVACTLTISFVFFLSAALVAFGSDRIRFMPLNWTSLVAVGLWILSAPIPPGTYSRLTIGLQLFVTENVLRALHLLGIAAGRHGNVIELATTSVGVEEACSGIRSLVSCIFAGLLFSATLVRGPWPRALVVVLAVPIAIAMNFVRSLTLTLLANAGVDIGGTWHDLTGFAVLAITAAILGGLALLLGRAAPGTSPQPAAPGEDAPVSGGLSIAQVFLSTGLILATVIVAFFVANTRPSIRQNIPVPNLAAVLPAQIPGWDVQTSQDIYQFSNTLKTDHLVQRTYLRNTPTGVEQITIYLAYWRAGQAPVSLVASHTPDACWPGSGWTPVSSPQTRAELVAGGRQLAPAEAREFVSGSFPQYVWFWHLYDGRPIAYRDPYSARELLKIAWKYGFTHDGDQLFVRVSSNRPWGTVTDEPLVAEVFNRLQPLGL